MNQKICVYTCITGNYDSLHDINNPEKNIDYYCFTNNKNLKSDTWKVVYIKNDGLDDHHLSRKIKMLGHPTINKKYDISVWMDASVTWQKDISDFVNTYCKEKPFSAIKHSQRNSIHEEAIACLQLHKDTKTNIVNTLSFLDSDGFPDNLGLYEMTVFIKKHNDPSVIKAMDLWFKMNQDFSKRDQLSFMYVVWKTNLSVNPIKINVWNNPWFTNHNHKVKAPSPTFDVYYGDPNSNFDFNQFFSLSLKDNNSLLSISQKIPKDCDNIYIYLPCTSGLICNDINSKPPISKYEIINATPYYKDYIFLSANGIIILYGSFKKGQSLNFSANLQQIDYSNLINYTEHICKTNAGLVKDNSAIKNNNKMLKEELENYSQTLKDIYNSKSWKIIRGIKKILH